VPNVNDRSVPGGQPYIAPAPDLPPAKPVAATPPAVDVPVDGLDSPKAADGAAVQSARKAITNKVSLAARIAKGAAIVGLAVGLVVGGVVWTKMAEHQPVKPPVTIEAPVEVAPHTLPQGHAPPDADAKGQSTPTETAPSQMPSGGPQVKPSIDMDALQDRPVFSPHTIRLQLPPGE